MKENSKMNGIIHIDDEKINRQGTISFVIKRMSILSLCNDLYRSPMLRRNNIVNVE